MRGRLPRSRGKDGRRAHDIVPMPLVCGSMPFAEEHMAEMRSTVRAASFAVLAQFDMAQVSRVVTGLIGVPTGILEL